MQNLENIKRSWKAEAEHINPGRLDKATWHKLVKHRIRKHKNISMQYFWASFTFQIIVYGFLTHVILRNSEDILVLLPGIFCLLLYVPFTVVLMRKYKRMAVVKQNEMLAWDLSIKEYVLEQNRLLTSFYTFKTRYEILLVPLSSATFVWIFFRLYIPGGVLANPIASFLVFILILGTCSAAILAENRRNFKTPIKKLQEILRDINAAKREN